MRDHPEITQVVNDMIGILQNSNLTWFEGIGAVQLLNHVLLDKIEWDERRIQ